MVILQDSCKTDGYLARSCKISEENIARRCIVLQDSTRFLQDNGWLSCKILARRMFILQDLARFRKKILQDDVSSCKILQDSCKITDGYLARFLRDGWLSCKVLQDFGGKYCKTMYRPARFYKILARSCKITIRIRLG